MSDKTSVQSFCWSPDGKKVAYTYRGVSEWKPGTVVNPETESHLVVCDPDGKNPKTITSVKSKDPLAVVDWR